MFFSAYQIESMLEDFQKSILELRNSPSDSLSISENALNEARQNNIGKNDIPFVDINPNNISDLVEDKKLCDPIVEYVLQCRAGQFVIPKYTPDNSPPKFPLVRNYLEDKPDLIKNDEKKIKLTVRNKKNESKLKDNIEKKETFDSVNQNPIDPINTRKLFSNIDDEDLNENYFSPRDMNLQIGNDRKILNFFELMNWKIVED